MKVFAEAILIIIALANIGVGAYVLCNAVFGQGHRLGMTTRGVLLSLLTFAVAGLDFLLFMTLVR